MTTAVQLGRVVEEDDFHGTIGAGAGSISPRRFMTAGAIAGTIVIGTLGVITPADAAALQAPIVESQTLPGVMAPSPNVPDGLDVPTLLERLRKVSGLSWGEMAYALGVSRRTIHNWLSGSRVASAHLSRLAKVEAIISGSGGGPAESTRAILVHPRVDGSSILDDLAFEHRRRSRSLSTVSVGDLIGTADEPVAGRTVETRRSSSVRGGTLPRGPRAER